ncbi:ferritin-like domain-containing protein [Patulibacter minatonensis]|uniref:YciE/YciF ferroxidase family protein n=1 Tax=Patulibacter minatonensis TaxID=298163 RepID=UPI0004B7FE10|nr:DUF892 family protein [Patulibacter minatonensis]
MTTADQKIVQYLKEARASELALVRVLQSQIAMTPEGSFRTGLERHLDETREHADRVHQRARDLDHGFDPIALAVGTTEAVIGQALALTKTPLDLLRGTGGEEKVLKNAKDAAATEALEIATYTAIKRLAERAGDTQTAELAASILSDEQRMLDHVLKELPALTDAVFEADVEGDGSFDLGRTGAAQSADEVASAAKATTQKTVAKAKGEGTAKRGSATAKKASATAKRTTDQAAASAAGNAKRATKTVRREATDIAEDARDVVGSLAAKDDAVADDATNVAADAIDDSSSESRGTADVGAGAAEEKPWPAYDELTVQEIQAVLLTADPELANRVEAYERANKGRAGVLSTVKQHTSNANA